MRIGSLFSGYGGLDLGVQAVLGGQVSWHCEIEPGPAKVLAHHRPGVPNLGDITAVDWSDVEPVDVLTGGFPCQDVSSAGRRAGLAPGTRSGLWNHMADAIDQLRPGLVVIENVRGLLSARAHSPKGGPNQRGSSGDLTLPSAAVRLFPTPTAMDSKSSGTGQSLTHGTTLTDAAREVHRSGAPTSPPFDAGSPSSGGPHPPPRRPAHVADSSSPRSSSSG